MKVRGKLSCGTLVTFGVDTPYAAYLKCREVLGSVFDIEIHCPMRTPLKFVPTMGCAEITDWLYFGR